MLTVRDNRVLDFLTEFKAADTSTIQTMFFDSRRMALNRLSGLVRLGEIKRERYSVSLEYVYYIKRPAQLKHAMTVSQQVAKFCKSHKVICYKCEPTLGSIRPDAMIGYIERGIEKIALIEVELSNKGLDTEKYRRFEQSERKGIFPDRPQLIVVTDRNFIQPSREYELIRI